jgi:hypothetical protein
MRRVPPIAAALVLYAALVGLLLPRASAGALQGQPFEGVARGFPVLRDSAGNKLADGDFAQWLDAERLHVRITYDFGDGRRIEENATFRQQPQLVQEEWSFRESKDGKLVRGFDVDFRSGAASASKREESELEEWTEKIETERGRTFAGFGFTLAIKAHRMRLVEGERVELQAVGFTPKPRVVSVELSHGGVDQMRMGGRVLHGDRFIIHAKIPWIARLFVEVPDTHIWLTTPPPAGFLRWEGPLAEPDDDVIRVDLLTGEPSGPARAVGW